MSRLIKEKPRARNQRVSNTRQRRQQHLLDVRVRSHKAAQYRNKRILVAISKVVLSFAIVGSALFGLHYGARRLFFENPDYRLSKIEVRTDGTLHRDLVLQTAELREGVNIFSVNLARVHDQLMQLPQVDEVQVVRNMPGEIALQITERKPVAWITSEENVSNPFDVNSAFLIDARGMVMKEKSFLSERLGLPVITGCPADELAAGKQIEFFEAKTALELLRLSTRSFMQTRFQIRAIDLSKGYCLVVTDKNHTRVMFGFDDLEAQLQRLEQFLVWSDEFKHELETVNLLVQRNVPVTFAKLPSEIINDTIDPEGEEPRILKATPVNPETKIETSAAKSKSDSTIRKATPVRKGKNKANG